MNDILAEAPALLAATPGAVRTLLADLPAAWLHRDEGPDTWSAYVIMGHLVHGEATDWLPRIRRLLEHGEDLPFEPFDRFAQLAAPRDRPIGELLDSFAEARADNLVELAGLELKPADLERRGLHPALGPVTLGQLISAWVAHDLNHLGQISRVLAGRLREAVGPWREFMPLVG